MGKRQEVIQHRHRIKSVKMSNSKKGIIAHSLRTKMAKNEQFNKGVMTVFW
jgi:hypothetical protein